MSATVTATRILDAAAALLAERGYRATATRAIAERAGVNEVTVFRTFGSKRGVLSALARRVAQHQAGHVAADIAVDDDVRETMAGLARLEAAGGVAEGGLVIRLALEARSVPEVAEVLGEGPASNLSGLTRYIELRQARGELRDDLPAAVIAEAFFSLTSSYVMIRTFLGRGPVEGAETVDQLFEIFWSGVAPRTSFPGPDAGDQPKEQS